MPKLRNRIARVFVVMMLAAGVLVGSGPLPALAADAVTVPAALLQKVWQEGTVRVIVRLGAPFAAEGRLRDEVAVGLQRGDIAAVGFLTSAEFESHPLTFRGYVTVLYRTFLGRAPDPGGLDGWESALRQHLLNTVNGSFIPSPEFQGRIPGICVS